ncbi:MAG: serine hydrolase [Leptolyngbyaceae cyanobacterium]
MSQLSLSASTNFDRGSSILIERDRTVATLSLSLDAAPPTSGLVATLASPDLGEFEVNQIQVVGGELMFTDAVQLQLAELLASKVTETVPGAAIAVSSPLGDWSGAVGAANIDGNVPMVAGDRFEVGSITKPFTAATLLKLVEAGTLTLEDTLTDWLPTAVTANVANAESITLRQLLNHTSGVAEYDFILLQQAMANPFIFLQDWQPEDIVALISDSGPMFAPGTGWQYANTNFILAGLVIEAATGNELATEIQAQIIEPLGLENTFFSTTKETVPGGYVSGYLDFDQNGGLDDVSIANLSWTWAAGAIVANTADLTTFGQALYAGDFLSEAMQAEMFTLVDTGRGYEYGLGMMSFNTPDLGRLVGHRGGSLGFNSNLWYSQEDDFTYVELLNGRTDETLVGNTIPAFRSGPIPAIGDLDGYEELAVTLTEAIAQISLPVADDGEVEAAETVTFTLQPGTDYTVNPTAQTSTLTIFDSEDITPMQLPDRVIAALENALDENLPSEVPGAAVAILTPEGDWFGASGFSDLAENIPLAPDDRFEAGSLTKKFEATTILQLVEEGLLTLEDTLTMWLDPAITELVPNASDITIAQILNHTSGITDYLDVLTDQASSNPTVFLQEWEIEQLVDFIDGVEPLFAPGTNWQYSNTNYLLAGLVIEAVTGNGYGQEIRDRIIDPLGLENTFIFGEEEIPGGYINGYWDFNGDGTLDNLSIINLSWTGSAGSLISNTEDLADFFDALLVDDALLQPATLEQMLDTIPVNSPNYDSYGLGIGTLESPNRFWYAHRGQTLNFRANLWYSPQEEITYVELFNGRSSSNLVSDLLPTYRRTIAPPTPDIITYQFDWTGQIAGFSVEGEFSYDASQFLTDGIVREENLESFDISFFDPDGNLLRTYEDNHLTFPEFNFAFDIDAREILQDGFFLAPDGLNVGEKTSVGDGFSGLNFWSRPEFNSQGEVPPPHLHIDDWADEFGFPIGFSSHEDVAFLTRTTAELIETGRVGDVYVDNPVAALEELGSRITVSPPPNDSGDFQVVSGVTSLFLNFSLFEIAGLIIQDATPTAEPFSNQFQLGFAITDGFTFESVPFVPEGILSHTGDITFSVVDDSILTNGDFAIAFDENRINETNSGFFVADTLEDGLGIDILFDISTPGRLLVANDELTIADADLLLAPELAQVLGLDDFVGEDVGNARIDAAIVPLLGLPPGELIGTEADDELIGFDSDDFINGLAGDDVYTGGAGADQFVFDLAQGIDTITDFEVGIDQISLGGLTPDGVQLVEWNSNTLVLTNSRELIGIVQGVTGLDVSVFG